MKRSSNTVALSERAHALAEERAQEEGFDSVNAYVSALIEEDRSAVLIKRWMRPRIKEGLASPSAGKMTKTKLDRLIRQGIARAPRRA